MDPITTAVQRRFVLGRQGLWPGRRWAGKAGSDAALHAAEAMQIDPVTVVAQSHDIALWGRVLDYDPADLLTLAYDERRFFDYGGLLYLYPMSELPYWHGRFARHREQGRWAEFMRDNPALLDQVRDELRSRGPLRNRDLDGNKVTGYRSSKDTGLALYAMWISGELMTYGRHGKERIYGFAADIAPAHLQAGVGEAEAEPYFLRKRLAQEGLAEQRTVRATLRDLRGRPVSLAETQAALAGLVAAGVATAVPVAGEREPRYLLRADLPLLETVRDGDVPDAWQPLGPTTLEEVTLLSPLEYVSARGRAKRLFDFDYVWEIYKPQAQRVYGPYTLPLLYGDRLVGRLDARHDRQRGALVLNGLWLEDWFAPDAAFRAALARGLDRFATFLGAEQIDDGALVGW